MIVYRLKMSDRLGSAYQEFHTDINQAGRVRATAEANGKWVGLEECVIDPSEFNNTDDLILACLNRAGFAIAVKELP